MYLLNDLRKSTLPQNRLFFGLIRNSKHQVDDFVEGVTFQNQLMDTFCEISFQPSASQRSGNNLKRSNYFDLKTKALTFLHVPYSLSALAVPIAEWREATR